MFQKVETLIDLGIEVLKEMRAYYSMRNGSELPLETGAEAAQVDKPKRGRKPKVAPVDTAAATFNAAASPFEGTPSEAVQVSIEDTVEAKRRAQEVMGLFIRRFLKATPPGLQRAKAILNELCERPVSSLEELTHADHVKMIPRFERELEQADAK